jgi:hypothetical protein
MGYDYPYVYRPLAQMVTPPGQPRSEAFDGLHRWSKDVNTVQLGCALVAALTLCGVEASPERQELPEDRSES